MTKTTNLIRFDWAAKNILRDKANFDILEVSSFPMSYAEIS